MGVSLLVIHIQELRTFITAFFPFQQNFVCNLLYNPKNRKQELFNLFFFIYYIQLHPLVFNSLLVSLTSLQSFRSLVPLRSIRSLYSFRLFVSLVDSFRLLPLFIRLVYKLQLFYFNRVHFASYSVFAPFIPLRSIHLGSVFIIVSISPLP